MFEIGRILSFFLSVLLLFPVMASAFFVPGSHWKQRLVLTIVKVAFAGCASFLSGCFFLKPRREGEALIDRLLETFPVRMFFWTMGAVMLLFVLSWYFEEYFVPLLWRNQPG